MNELNELYSEIKGECIKLIYDKNIDMEELSYRVGMDTNYLYKLLNSNDEDFSLYLRLYEVLLGW